MVLQFRLRPGDSLQVYNCTILHKFHHKDDIFSPQSIRQGSGCQNKLVSSRFSESAYSEEEGENQGDDQGDDQGGEDEEEDKNDLMDYILQLESAADKYQPGFPLTFLQARF